MPKSPVLDRIVPSPDESYRDELAEMFYENFVNRIPWRLLPENRDSVISLISSSLNLSDVYAGLDSDGNLLAFACVTDRGRTLCLEPGWLRRTWGTWGALWRTALLGVLHFGHCGKGYLRVEALVVRPELRGRGIGSQLMQRILSDARAEGHSFVTIDLGDDNADARHIYESVGFRVARTMWAPAAGYLGLRNIVVMRLDL